MSDEKEATQIDAEPPTPPPEGDSTDANEVVLDSEHSTAPGREAAKWRKQLREVEAQRDSLVGKVEALQRAQVDAAVTATGLKPAAVWASGAQLADLVGDDGTPDQEKIAAAVTAAREQLGINDQPPPKRPARGGLVSGASTPREPVNRWSEAFAPPNSRR